MNGQPLSRFFWNVWKIAFMADWNTSYALSCSFRKCVIKIAKVTELLTTLFVPLTWIYEVSKLESHWVLFIKLTEARTCLGCSLISFGNSARGLSSRSDLDLTLFLSWLNSPLWVELDSRQQSYFPFVLFTKLDSKKARKSSLWFMGFLLLYAMLSSVQLCYTILHCVKVFSILLVILLLNGTLLGNIQW